MFFPIGNSCAFSPRKQGQTCFPSLVIDVTDFSLFTSLCSLLYVFVHQSPLLKYLNWRCRYGEGLKHDMNNVTKQAQLTFGLLVYL